jgi:hypothetical protein
VLTITFVDADHHGYLQPAGRLLDRRKVFRAEADRVVEQQSVEVRGEGVIVTRP